MNNRKLERIMLDYKATGNEDILAEVLSHPELKRFMNGVVAKYNKINWGLNQKEDLLRIAETTIWKSLIKYKFICPCCGLKCLTEEAFKQHSLKRHKAICKPKTGIWEFVKYQIGAYLQNEIKKEYSECRSEKKTTHGKLDMVDEHFNSNEADGDVLEILDSIVNSNTDFTSDSDIMMLVNQVVKQLDETSVEIIMGILNDSTATEIATGFFEKGLYGSLQSARVSINRKLNTVIRSKFKALKA